MRRLVLAVAVAVLAGAGTAQAAPLKASQDPFYSWDGALRDVALGTILRRRDINVAEGGIPTPVKATQVLYRTTDQLRKPTVTVATIIEPLLGADPTKVVSYQTAYDDLGETCAPSYTLQGGNPTAVSPTLEIQLMLGYVLQGYTVVTSDYEGPTHNYTSGQQSGRGTLDGIRAAANLLEPPSPPRVGLVGYSGGATATQWASELASTYAPELNIIAVAEGGVPVNYPHTIGYVDGTEDWGGVLPYVLVGLTRANHLDLTPYLSDLGVQALADVADKCLDTDLYKAATMQSLLKPEWSDFKSIRPLVKILNTQVMGVTGTPTAPVLMGNGTADGRGDGVMITADVEALAHGYCEQGVPVRFKEYSGMDHVGAIVPFELDATAFINDRFAGRTDNGCADVGAGDPVTKLPVPPRLRVRATRVRRDAHALYVRARVTAGIGTGVRATVLRRGTRVASVAVDDVLSTTARTLRVPVGHLRAGRRYVVVVRTTIAGRRCSTRVA